MNSLVPLIILLLAIAYLSIVYGVLKMAQKSSYNTITSSKTTMEGDRGIETSWDRYQSITRDLE